MSGYIGWLLCKAFGHKWELPDQRQRIVECKRCHHIGKIQKDQ